MVKSRLNFYKKFKKIYKNNFKYYSIFLIENNTKYNSLCFLEFNSILLSNSFFLKKIKLNNFNYKNKYFLKNRKIIFKNKNVNLIYF